MMEYWNNGRMGNRNQCTMLDDHLKLAIDHFVMSILFDPIFRPSITPIFLGKFILQIEWRRHKIEIHGADGYYWRWTGRM